MKDLLVVDSSVFNKLYLDEPDRDKAVYLFSLSVSKMTQLIAPTLLFYEVVHTSQSYGLPSKTIIRLLNRQTEKNLILLEPSLDHIQKALEIIETGHPKSGYPSIYDSIFHAIAIVEDTFLVTADKKHFAKTKSLGHILLLDDVESLRDWD
ncbi:type II toxin-antitoxin system VapC family toxin [bacterium]|nr:type II toxin-antitoxin system VapC family toxin [bacterium]